MRINTLIDKHECGLVFYNKLVNSKWLGNHFIDPFRLNPNLDYQNFKELSVAALPLPLPYRDFNFGGKSLTGGETEGYSKKK